MCRVLGVAVSGYYLWLQRPISNHDQEDARLLRLIRASFIASHGVYGAPRVFLDLREAGETCSKHCVGRLMRDQYRLGFLDVGGWDTHVNEGGAQGALAANVESLGRGLQVFSQTLGAESVSYTHLTLPTILRV